MFKNKTGFSLSERDKVTERANTLFTSMKDTKKDEEKKKKKGLGFSIFDKDEEKPKVTEPKTYEKAKTMIEKENQEKDKLQKRADLLYPDKKEEQKIKKGTEEKSIDIFKEKKDKGKDIIKKEITKEETTQNTNFKKNSHEYNKNYIKELRNISEKESDKRFLENMEHILDAEGGYNNYKEDKPTNIGVTQEIYDIYRKEKGLKPQDVKNINIEDATQIYYKYFWKPSKAEELDPALGLAYFDMYVNSSPKDAKAVLKRSNNDLKEFIKNRRKFYDDVVKNKPEKIKFRKGWDNRLNNLENYINKKYNKEEED